MFLRQVYSILARNIDPPASIIWGNPDLLHLFEVYTGEQAFERHKQTPHFRTHQETTKDWLAAPLDIATGNHLFPADTVWRKQG